MAGTGDEEREPPRRGFDRRPGALKAGRATSPDHMAGGGSGDTRRSAGPGNAHRADERAGERAGEERGSAERRGDERHDTLRQSAAAPAPGVKGDGGSPSGPPGEPDFARARLREIALAFGLLTRIPVPTLEAVAATEIGRSVWAFPLAGALVGMLGAIAYSLAYAAGLDATVSAVVALAVTIIATGAFHEDGLADFCDGIGGGRTRERKLEIMRDSRIGSYGALALFLSLGLRWSALQMLALPNYVAPALILCHGGARGLIGIVYLLAGPARPDGLAAGAGRPPAVAMVAGLAIAAALALLLLPLVPALAALAAGAAAVALVTLVARVQVGGYTGDTIGAAEQIAEIAMLIVVAALLR
ncbi:MAG: adenosylcobinamide-GDP ribazoletransferase [Hyphomicrobiaceae bacterium]